MQARGAGVAPVPPGPKLDARRVRRYAGAATVVHLVCLEIALVVLGAAFLVSPTLLLPAGVGAAVLLLVVFGRADGRWWYEEAAARWRLRRRRAVGAKAMNRLALAEPRARAMATLVPGLAIRNVLDRGRSIGVGFDDEGWFAAVAVGTWSDVSGERAFRLELDQVVRILDESTVPISSLQLVSFQTQAPAGIIESTGPAAQSYQELAAPDGCPLDQAVWLVVRLSPTDAVEAASSRGGGVSGVDRALAAVIGRIEKTLAAAGVPHEVLDADGLGDALTLSCGLDALPPTPRGAPLARERWVAWNAGGLEHVSFTVTGWPRDPTNDLFTGLSSLSACAVAVSIALRPQGTEIGFLGLVRVVAPSARLRGAVRQLTGTARGLGLRLRRLDGEHGRAVYATAPTGGGI